MARSNKDSAAVRILRSVGLVCALHGQLPRAGATTVVVIRTPEEIVIAADSAVTVRFNSQSATSKSGCKIFEVDAKLFFSVSGLVTDGLTGFNIPRIVMSSSLGSGSVAEKLARVEREVEKAVVGELPHMRERDPAGYEKLIRSAGAVTVLLAGIDAGVPVVTSFSLGLSASATGVIETSKLQESCPGNCPSGVRAFWLGEGDAIQRLRARGGLPALGMPELARFLVQTEIDAGAPGVAAPVDVLRILPGGPIWVEKKQGCPVTMAADMK
jgi:hypothetical protein